LRLGDPCPAFYARKPSRKPMLAYKQTHERSD
jgi:hypothetical protein